MQESNQLPVKNVSHTAWLVAAFRAQESERPDAHFNDNLAQKLLGGLENEYLSRFSEQVKSDNWILTVRTCQIDQLILTAIQNGVTTILNLGAGLDTRPYRLPLPSALRWVEADFPELIAYKNKTLQDERPNCHLERIPVDLSNSEARDEILKRLDKQSTSTLVLTEGLLGYLTEPNVVELAKELASMRSCEYWLMDVFNRSFFEITKNSWRDDLGKVQEGDVKLHFIPENTASFLEPFGWHLKKFLSFGKGASELKRFPKTHDAESIKSENGFYESGVCLFRNKHI